VYGENQKVCKNRRALEPRFFDVGGPPFARKPNMFPGPLRQGPDCIVELLSWRSCVLWVTPGLEFRSASFVNLLGNWSLLVHECSSPN
jgi:hypothetical protein